ncbi:MAG: type II and III secretion system protein [Gammaproteobacteria bacterium]|uniref:type II secretion system protein GspD n=1 Tax=Rhodoferax sp. TaxID=50421 RepID=UPI0017B4F439|nr:secretin N-terminal domain-containing protein [Rhodoferax sp.]MBU3898058.1 type II and III secretion system protein [Gammaproteobacteria bacterium]MBA3058557.1 type II and III secretion system protein [Rhodoferax sp.]MBU3999185.1 type II and III secretion system protein [Gammaproteobacteria bacterium]MBU4081748.1 type II and III secretion system protein [Gammaproteobacteria bacterium]MBU4112759.1 type II and III secretion system protein [Gammaproteobacteria bacterium]
MNNVNVQDLLFALARDAKLNVDIHPSIAGTVTMNVHDQTLTEILDRVARQVDLRYEMEGKNLSIQPDSPYLKHYRVDYPNIQRDAKTSISTSTNVASTGGGAGSTGGGGGSNASTSSIENTSNNRFWTTLYGNLVDLLRETDKVLPEVATAAVPQPALNPGNTGTGTGTGVVAAPAAAVALPRTTFREAASVIANPETGNISVRATQNQHAKVREFLDRVLSSARRQVLIEATVVEVDLSSRYQQGIDWSLLQTGGANAGSGITVRPAGGSGGLQTGGLVSSIASLSFKQFRLWDGDTDLSAMLSLLESFGTLRVLSSPKVSVLNNQSSVLKVVDNKVYFSITVTPGTAASLGVAATPATYTTTINTVPIGFLMTVVPQISEANEVTLNLRPTISRITGYATDPNPVLAQNNLINRIPEVQTREMESVLRVQSGDIAILGGLMQDSRDNNSDEVPGLNRVSFLGDLFKYRNDSSSKSELVIFLRPTVLRDASLDADLRDYRALLPQAIDAVRINAGPSRAPLPSLRN